MVTQADATVRIGRPHHVEPDGQGSGCCQ
jgi:hypothetical protein